MLTTLSLDPLKSAFIKTLYSLQTTELEIRNIGYTDRREIGDFSSISVSVLMLPVLQGICPQTILLTCSTDRLPWKHQVENSVERRGNKRR